MNGLDHSLWSDLVGLPFEFKGRGPDNYDCLGLMIEIYKRRGIIIPDFTYSSDQSEQAKLLSNAPNGWYRCDIKPGCGLLFSRNGLPVHVGVAIDNFRFIHATEDFNQVIISKLDAIYTKRLIGAYDYAV